MVPAKNNQDGQQKIDTYKKAAEIVVKMNRRVLERLKDK